MMVYLFDKGRLGVIVAPSLESAIDKMAEILQKDFQELAITERNIIIPDKKVLQKTLYEVVELEEHDSLNSMGLFINPNEYTETTYVGSLFDEKEENDYELS